MKASIDKMKQIAGALRNRPADPDVAYTRMVEAQSVFAETIELLAGMTDNRLQSLDVSMRAITSTMQVVQTSMSAQSQSAQSGVNSKVGGRPMCESRCVGSLTILGSDKSQFKNWNEKLINVLAQTLGLGWRKFMRSLNRQLDQDRRILDVTELNNLDGAGVLGDAQ